MAGMHFTLNLTPLYAAQNAVYEAAMARLHDAVQSVLINTTAEWQTAVHEAKLWEGERTAYANSISWRMTGDFKGEVVAEYRLADQIENGRPPYDMKRMLDTSMKVRTNKRGQRYLIIPFRHNTPGYNAHAPDMPQHVYQAAKKLTFSKVTGMGTRASGTGAMDPKTRQPVQVPQAKYLWGTRLPAGMMGPNPKGKVDRYAGMVRFQNTASKSGKSSMFMTFRVMKEGSPGWVIAARAGLKLAEGVSQKMGPIAQQEFLAAIKGEL